MNDLADLIAGLSDPVAYPFCVDTVEVRQTHISVVFLAGDFVYKVKKSVDYGFLDFGTLEKRRHYCDEEVRLNRRLAPDVYLGVVPITRCSGHLRFEGDGPPIEWAVKMRRLPDEATLQNRLIHEDVSFDTMRDLGSKIADFHANARYGAEVDAQGHFDVVAGNARENYEQSTDQVDLTVSEAVFTRIKSLTEDALTRHRSLIQSRADRGVTRDTHGDLRLEHVYLFPDSKPPGNLIVIDCIEFAERFRFADPIADVAFLVMELNRQGRRDLANEFMDAYIQTSGDEEGRRLTSFYTAYRAVVRGKVEGMKLSRPEITEAGRATAKSKSQSSWLLALDELETPPRRPCLLLVTGLPGTGKSTLARELVEHGDFELIRSDVVRKELWSKLPACRKIQNASWKLTPQGFGEGIYSAEWNRRTYDECLRQAERMLFQGQRVIIDANFRADADRLRFLDAAKRWGVRYGLLLCEADAAVVRTRLSKRRDDASDADWSVYLRASESWEPFSSTSQSAMRVINTGGSVNDARSEALKVLQQLNVG